MSLFVICDHFKYNVQMIIEFLLSFCVVISFHNTFKYRHSLLWLSETFYNNSNNNYNYTMITLGVTASRWEKNVFLFTCLVKFSYLYTDQHSRNWDDDNNITHQPCIHYIEILFDLENVFRAEFQLHWSHPSCILVAVNK